MYFKRKFDEFLDFSRDYYLKIVRKLVSSLPLTVLLTLLTILLIIIGFVRTSTSFLPEEDQGIIFANVQLDDTAGINATDEILQKIWGFEFDGESRTVDVHIRTLRTKLGDVGNLIETVRGMGYKIGGGEV